MSAYDPRDSSRTPFERLEKHRMVVVMDVEQLTRASYSNGPWYARTYSSVMNWFIGDVIVGS